MAAAGEFGLRFGLAFQLMDDQMDLDALAPALTALAALPAGAARSAMEPSPTSC